MHEPAACQPHQENSNRVAGMEADAADASTLPESEWQRNTLPMSQYFHASYKGAPGSKKKTQRNQAHVSKW
jgi:hypothetical protein